MKCFLVSLSGEVQFVPSPFYRLFNAHKDDRLGIYHTVNERLTNSFGNGLCGCCFFHVLNFNGEYISNYFRLPSPGAPP